MPFNPGDLPWWGWLLCAAGAATAGVVVFYAADANKGKPIGYLLRLIGLVLAVAVVTTGGIGVAQFAKWASSLSFWSWMTN